MESDHWRYFKSRPACTHARVAKPLASNICVLMQMDNIQIDTKCMWLLFETVITGEVEVSSLFDLPTTLCQ